MRQIVRVFQPAPEGTVFGPGVFSGQIGRRFPLRIPGFGERTCELASAEVAADGSGVSLVFRLPDDVGIPTGPVSIV
jgi:hypothetical protein